MKVNFDITDNHSLTISGRHFDLHNNFDFVGFENNIEDKEIRLHWRKSKGEWVDSNEFSSLVLIHRQVSFLKVIEQDAESSSDDGSCLGEISFFPSTAREFDDSILPQSKPNDGDDIKYFFENGQRIIIHCEQIELNLKLPKEESDTNFTYNKLTEEEAFWVMRYFLEEHYDLAGGEFDLSDILSATQPFEFDDNGHFDGEVKGKRRIAPADSGMVWYWNEAVKKFREQGRPTSSPLMK